MMLVDLGLGFRVSLSLSHSQDLEFLGERSESAAMGGLAVDLGLGLGHLSLLLSHDLKSFWMDDQFTVHAVSIFILLGSLWINLDSECHCAVRYLCTYC